MWRRSQRSEEDDRTARSVVICLTPSSSEDYAVELNAAVRLWAGPLEGGSLIFTSSLAVYGVQHFIVQFRRRCHQLLHII